MKPKRKVADLRSGNYRGQDLAGLRSSNLDVILGVIWENAPISRTELADITGLAPSSITRLIKQLKESQLVRNVGKGESSGGRQPTLIAPNPDAGLTISLELDSQNIRGGIFDATNQLLKVYEQPLEGYGPDNIQKKLLNFTQTLMEDCVEDDRDVLGVGVGISGRVDENTGEIIESYNLRLNDFPVRKVLANSFHLPVYVETDASVAALAEKYYGAGRWSEDFVYLLISTGIGAGIIMDGEIYRGKAGMPGEIGHIVVDRHGPICLCGRRGCLEAVASETAILANAKQLLMPSGESAGFALNLPEGQPLSLQTLDQAAEHGNESAQILIRNAADNIAFAISTIATILNIELMVLGGSVVRGLGDRFFENIKTSLDVYRQRKQSIRVVRARLDKNAFLKGVSMLTLREILRT